jgi:hypothetical protein
MEKITMLLTKKALEKILQDWRVSIPTELEKELLHEYGNLVADDEGHLHDYTEQDICEQLRKIVRPYQEADKEVKHFTLT